MSNKRERDGLCYDKLVSDKKLRLEDDGNNLVDDDILFETVALSSEVKTVLNYDSIFNEFVVVIEKVTPSGNRSIGLNEIAIKGLLKKLPLAFKLVDRYSNRKAGKTIDIPLEIVPSDGEDNGALPILFIKENLYKQGELKLDIRRCSKPKDGGYIYTQNGVRLSVDTVKKLLGQLLKFVKIIDDSVKSTKTLLEITEVCMMANIIEDLNSEQGCSGCDTDQPSQTQHIDVGGCLREWTDVVAENWDTAQQILDPDDVIDTAVMVAAKLPSIRGVVRSSVTSLARNSDEQVKELVINKSLESDNEIYATTQLVLKQ